MKDTNAFTLAIGDGANDVNMIQTATIGIGIMGKEGTQASTMSDYAVPNFQSVRRLLFWHGRKIGAYSSIFMPFFLFKNNLNNFKLIFSNFVNGFSGLTLF